ncbi:endogenous retrovirus group FC1 Env polyprotein-like, partial [Rhinolophus ferrumequinum]|uniref:endogenous retrovirus group FC1 Env polyprotein-like n=1 Tax=Rhinolophus ferrumequinum TaxID=59479 RepID=UPI00140F7180
IHRTAASLPENFHSCSKRAAFLPLILGVSLASSFVAAGLGAGALGHSVHSAQDLETRLQVAIEASSTSIGSLQRQLTSVAQVTLQNRRALDLLTAEKGGTCLCLREECCYYINESGLVKENVQTLNKLQEELQRRRGSTSPPSDWWQSPLTTWVVPLIGPLVLISLLLLMAPCFLNFLQNRLHEMSRVTVNQLPLHPHSRCPRALPSLTRPRTPLCPIVSRKQ